MERLTACFCKYSHGEFSVFFRDFLEEEQTVSSDLFLIADIRIVLRRWGRSNYPRVHNHR